MLPPGLAVAVESERVRFIEKHGLPRAQDFLWSPVEWHRDEIEYGDEGLVTVAEEANQILWQKSREEQARRFTDKVAKRLAKAGVAKLLPATDDAVLFAMDIEAGDGADGVRRATPAKARNALVKRGLL